MPSISRLRGPSARPCSIALATALVVWTPDWRPPPLLPSASLQAVARKDGSLSVADDVVKTLQTRLTEIEEKLDPLLNEADELREALRRLLGNE